MAKTLGSTASSIMAEPLLFVCQSRRVRRGSDLRRASLLTLQTPVGAVHTAFGSHELANVILTLVGAAEGVFLLSETRLVPELVPAERTAPVLVLYEYEDYEAAMSEDPSFPWTEHIVQYDFAAAASTASVSLDRFGLRRATSEE